MSGSTDQAPRWSWLRDRALRDRGRLDRDPGFAFEVAYWADVIASHTVDWSWSAPDKDWRSLEASLQACRHPDVAELARSRDGRPLWWFPERPFGSEAAAELAARISAGTVAVVRLVRLLTDPDPGLRLAAAHRLVQLTDPTVLRLLRDEEVGDDLALVVSSELRWRKLPENWMDFLARHRRPAVRARMALRTTIPPARLRELARDRDESVRRAVLANVEVPVDRVVSLLDDPVGHVRKAAAVELRHRFTGAAADPLCGSADPGVRAEALRLPGGPGDARLARLSRDPDREIAVAATVTWARETRDPAVTRRLASRRCRIGVGLELVDNPSSTAADHAVLARHRSVQVRRAVAQRSPHRAALAGAWRDEDVEVRTRAAENPANGSWCLSLLGSDSSQYVREAVAGNPSAAPPTAERLAGSRVPAIRSAALGNPSLPVRLLLDLTPSGEWPGPATLDKIATLVRDEDHRQVIARLAADPASPSYLIGAISRRKRLGDYTWHIARNPSTSDYLVTTLMHHDDALVRAGIAVHPKLRRKHLIEMAADHTVVVRAAAARARRTRNRGFFHALLREGDWKRHPEELADFVMRCGHAPHWVVEAAVKRAPKLAKRLAAHPSTPLATAAVILPKDPDVFDRLVEHWGDDATARVHAALAERWNRPGDELMAVVAAMA